MIFLDILHNKKIIGVFPLDFGVCVYVIFFFFFFFWGGLKVAKFCKKKPSVSA